MEMDSLCLTWIPKENRYRVTALTFKDGLVETYVNDLKEFIQLLQEYEDKYAA